MNIHLHDNPSFDPQATIWLAQAANSMEADDFYATHTRIECAAEIRRRYDVLKAAS